MQSKRKLAPRLAAAFLLAIAALTAAACRVDRRFEDAPPPGPECNTDAYYVKGLCDDEIADLRWAAEYENHPRLADLNAASLHQVLTETGDVDRAAALFYERVLRDPRNRAFYEYLERKEPELMRSAPDFSRHNILLAMVPGMFWADNPDVGADGAVLRRLVAGMGLKEDVVEVDQTGTVEENARFICDYIKNRGDVDAILLASVSKGSSDVKYAVKLCGREPYFAKVIGWYNIGGINRGSVLVNDMNDDWSNKIEARSYFCLNGYNWDGLMSLRADPGSPLDFALPLPDDFLLINVVGVPTRRFVSSRARPYYEYLARYGPSDGISILSDTYMDGGITWASWRNDHYFRLPITEAKMSAFVVYIIEKQMPKIRALQSRPPRV